MSTSAVATSRRHATAGRPSERFRRGQQQPPLLEDSTFWQRFQSFRQRNKLIGKDGTKYNTHRPQHHRQCSRKLSFTSDDYATEACSEQDDSQYSAHGAHKLKRILKEPNNSNNRQRRKEKRKHPRQVRFGMVIESYHQCILGDHPVPDDGPALTIAWEAFFRETFFVGDKYGGNDDAPPKRVRRLTGGERRDILMADYSSSLNDSRTMYAEMARVSSINRRIRKSRNTELKAYLEEKELEQIQRDKAREGALDMLLL